MRARFAFLALIVTSLFWGCKESVEFENPVYTCECGNVVWEGVSYPFLMAEYFHEPDSNLLSRRYMTTLDIQSPLETEAHHVNFSLYVDTVTQSLFNLDEDDLRIKIEEVNYNDPFIPIREYEADIAFVTVDPAITTGPEFVTFQMQIVEMLNGSPAGFPFTFEGNFRVNVIY